MSLQESKSVGHLEQAPSHPFLKEAEQPCFAANTQAAPLLGHHSSPAIQMEVFHLTSYTVGGRAILEVMLTVRSRFGNTDNTNCIESS